MLHQTIRQHLSLSEPVSVVPGRPVLRLVGVSLLPVSDSHPLQLSSGPPLSSTPPPAPTPAEPCRASLGCQQSLIARRHRDHLCQHRGNVSYPHLTMETAAWSGSAAAHHYTQHHQQQQYNNTCKHECLELNKQEHARQNWISRHFSTHGSKPRSGHSRVMDQISKQNILFTYY